MHNSFYQCLILALVLFFPTDIKADQTNNGLIYSKPTSNIVLDGQLDDWTNDHQKHPIAYKLYGDEHLGDSDFTGEFMISHNAFTSEVYLAIIIKDDQVIWEEEGSDAILLFLNEQHKIGGSGTAEFRIEGGGIRSFGDKRSWDSKMKAYTDIDKVDYVEKASGNQLILEAKISLNETIYKNRLIGFDIIYVDQDEESYSEYAFTYVYAKTVNAQPFRIGNVIFADENLQTGILKNKVQWKDRSMDFGIEGVHIHSLDDPRFWLYRRVDRDGAFEIRLPEGEYELKPGKIAFFNNMNYAKADTAIGKKVKVQSTSMSIPFPLQLVEVPKPNFNLKGNIVNDFNVDSAQKIDATIRKMMSYYQIEGVQFALLKDGKITYQKSYGVRNNYSKEAVQNSDLFEVASITKPVFAFAAMRLLEKGVFDLDTPLHTYLEYDEISDQPYSKLITARHVLSHQTGLPNWPQNGKLEFQFKPGEGFSYSGSSYEYLARVLSELTGKPKHEYLNEEINQVLGIEHFYFIDEPYLEKHKVHGHYNGYPGKIDLPEDAWVAGGLITNVEALTKFIHAVKDRKGLKPETYDLWLSKQNNTNKDSKENNWGAEEYMTFGWFVEKAPHGKVLRHSGNNGDFKSMLRYYEDLDAGYIMLVNGNTGGFITDEIEKILIDPKSISN